MLRTSILRQRCPPLRYSSRNFYSSFIRRSQGGFAEKVGRPSVRNQVLFFVVGSSLVFSYAAFKTNLETEQCKKSAIESGSLNEAEASSSTSLRRYAQGELVKELRGGYAYIARDAQWIPDVLRPYLAHAYVAILQPYADAGPGKRMCWKICLLNAGIWLAWKINSLEPRMARSFMHNPLSGLSYTLITAVFSHRSVIHLFFNCLALEGFGSAASTFLMREHNTIDGRSESTNVWHFMAFFLSAGTFSSLLSHVASVKFKYPRLVKQLSSPAATPARVDSWSAAIAASSTSRSVASTTATNSANILPSLGASGAVYACVTLTACAFPDSKIALAIPPSYPINIQWGVGSLVCLDIIGIIRGWRIFDHWAHLGGALFGVAYYYGGSQMWNTLRNNLPPSPRNEAR